MTAQKPRGTFWKYGKFLAMALLLVIGLSMVALGVLAWFMERPMPLSSTYRLTVPRGATLSQMAAKLEEDRLIPDKRLLTLSARWMGGGNSIKAGRYRFEPGVTPLDVIDRLSSGAMEMTQIRVIEGMTFEDFKKQIRASPDLNNTVVDQSNAEIMRSLGAVEMSPEGLFFPDTYTLASGSDDIVLLKMAYQALKNRLTQAWMSRREGLPVGTPYEALILASIVEKETGANDDRALVASVLMNRLKAGMKLQVDPTVIYGLGSDFTGTLRKAHLRQDTPYNTYTRAGLPPTPIALPSQASINAVMQAPDTKYYYFVARGDGTSEFSENLAAHNQAVSRYILRRGARP
ncbi:MAG: endolytic transglycosylase MltG [Burkholderiales bacterium]|jgi:UPF0755 protein|nr:endolytic transglycosylase MltG [Burkholderiales bacterium]